MAIKINVMNKGDSVFEINENFVAVKRKNGEVDVIPIYNDEGVYRLDLENVLTVSYGNNTIEFTSDDSDVEITTF